MDYTIRLTVFPSTEGELFALGVKHDDPNLLTVNGYALHERVRAIIQERTGLSLLPSTRFVVIGREDGMPYPEIAEVIGELLDAVATSSNPVPPLEIGQSHILGSEVIVMPAPRDVALQHYEFPLRTLKNLDYQITVYQPANKEEAEEAIDYVNRLLIYNKKQEDPIYLYNPVKVEEFGDITTVIFLAKRGNTVIGYCACTILRYRQEIKTILDRTMKTLLERDETLSERFFMNVPLSHCYEIKGLSASPEEAGKNVGLVLLYHAIDFIMSDRIRALYPVSHLASQAASYITKRLLLNNFEFRYHGKNDFLNENFVETLDEKTKSLFVRVMTELLASWVLFFRDHSQSLKQLLIDSSKLRLDLEVLEPIFLVIQDAIRVYQLYYLLLKTTSRARAFDCYNQQTLNELDDLFTQLKRLLSVSTGRSSRRYSSLFDYFSENVANLRTYIGSTERSLATLTSKIYTLRLPQVEQVPTISEVFKNLGFLQEKLRGQNKIIYDEGYDIIYEAILHTLTLTRVLRARESENKVRVTEEVFLKTLQCINGLVREDLAKPYNYEVPDKQWHRMEPPMDELLELMEKHASFKLSSYFSDLQEVRLAVTQRIKFLQANADAYYTTTIEVLKVSPQETYGFNCWVSFERLKENEQRISERYHQRLGITTPVETIEICPSSPTPHLEPPPTLDEVRSEINQLYDILVLQPPPTNIISYRGQEALISQLQEYFSQLVEILKEQTTPLEMEVEPEPEPDLPMMVEAIIPQSVLEYNVSDFIDENLFMNLPESILNRASL